MNNNLTNGDESTFKKESDSPSTAVPDSRTTDNSHKRIIFRLKIARCTIYIGICGIIVLSLVGYIFAIWNKDVSDLSLEVIKDGISILATITTLALGYIAGSNIENTTR